MRRERIGDASISYVFHVPRVIAHFTEVPKFSSHDGKMQRTVEQTLDVAVSSVLSVPVPHIESTQQPTVRQVLKERPTAESSGRCACTRSSSRGHVVGTRGHPKARASDTGRPGRLRDVPSNAQTTKSPKELQSPKIQRIMGSFWQEMWRSNFDDHTPGQYTGQYHGTTRAFMKSHQVSVSMFRDVDSLDMPAFHHMHVG